MYAERLVIPHATPTALALHDKDYGARLKDVLKSFEVQAPMEGKISCGIATTREDRCKRLLIATDRYLQENYIVSEDLNDQGLYIDKYERSSIPLVAKVLTKNDQGVYEEQVVSSLRLVMNVSPHGLPINSDDDIEVDPEYSFLVSAAPFEWSQLASVVNAHVPKGSNAFYGLIRTSFELMYALGQNYAVATIDDRVRKLLNQRNNFDLISVGPTVDYMGSLSTPTLIDIADVIRSTATSKRNKPLADFLATGTAVGFQWYQGK